MPSFSLLTFEKQLNTWGRYKEPFIFIIDFECKKPLAFQVDKINASDIKFDFRGFANIPPARKGDVQIVSDPIDLHVYRSKFNSVQRHILQGDSYLTNLTIKTPIKSTKTLNELLTISHAPYRVLYKDEFLVFSPETFIRIEQGKIFTYPMKGTIDAAIENAEATILNDEKEKAEHVTIVDLLRNDLSLVATNVHVSRFRYIDRIKTHDKTLLQMSSEVTGDLSPDYYEQIGSILVTLLPAGSVSGAPKKKTLEIIREAEMEERGYYTGVMGYFDGEKLDSAVMIRYIEKDNAGALVYRSGGGITAQSNCEKEYHESLAKVYVPVV
jgi:para-aminobenzoate synthetase component I